MLVSSTSMKAARATTTAISQGLNFGRQGSAGNTGAAPAPVEADAEFESSDSSAILAQTRVLLFFGSRPRVSPKLSASRTFRCLAVLSGQISPGLKELSQLWTIAVPGEENYHRTWPDQVGTPFQPWRSPPFHNATGQFP